MANIFAAFPRTLETFWWVKGHPGWILGHTQCTMHQKDHIPDHVLLSSMFKINVGHLWTSCGENEIFLRHQKKKTWTSPLQQKHCLHARTFFRFCCHLTYQVHLCLPNIIFFFTYLIHWSCTFSLFKWQGRSTIYSATENIGPTWFNNKICHVKKKIIKKKEFFVLFQELYYFYKSFGL